MSKRVRDDHRAEYSVVGVSEKKANKASKKLNYSSRVLIVCVAICVLVVVSVVMMGLYFGGVFDELDKVTHNKNDGNKEDYFVDYKFDSSNLPTGYYADFVFTSGDKEYKFTAYLFRSYAQDTVNNFMTYANAGYYNGTVISDATYNASETKGSAICGGYTLNAQGEKVRKIPMLFNGAIKGEFINNGYEDNLLSHVAGVITMVRGDNYDSATTEFCMLAYDDKSLNGDYAGFAKITTTKGVATLRTITELASSGKIVTLKTVTIRKKS